MALCFSIDISRRLLLPTNPEYAVPVVIPMPTFIPSASSPWRMSMAASTPRVGSFSCGEKGGMPPSCQLTNACYGRQPSA